MNSAPAPDITSLQKTKKKGGLVAVAITATILLATGSGTFFWINKMRAAAPVVAPAEKTQQPAGQQPAGMALGGSARIGALQMDDSADLPVTPAPAKAPAEEEIPDSKPTVPKGYGFAEKAGGGAEQANPAPTQEPANSRLQNLQAADTGVALQPPEPPKPASTPDNKKVQGIDPRDVGVTTNDGPEKEYEETALTVQRTLTAVMGDDRQMIRLKVPVMYKSRTLRLEGETLAEARRIQTEMKAKALALATMKGDLERLLEDWNVLVKKSTPADALLPESPTLPENQSAGKLNRKDNPNLEPGKAISYEIVTP